MMRRIQRSLQVHNKMRDSVNNRLRHGTSEWRNALAHGCTEWRCRLVVWQHFGRSKSIVQDRLRRFKETGSVKDRPRSGRPSAQVEEDGETLAETVVADPFITLPQFQSILLDENVNASQSTISRRLTALGHRIYRPLKFSRLKTTHKVVRLRWCRQYRF